MRRLQAERAGHRPRLDDEVVRLLEALAVERRVDAGRELLLPAAADKAGDQPPLRDHVDHRQLFGQPHRVLGQRERVAEQNDLHAFGRGGEHRGEHIAFACMQNGALWCSFSIIPSTPISSA